ncbi:MAG: hypothetical protein IPM45_10160 [Acidimicrobiales bacterium]|nr:hypothetical protein [Acidimicrobiales bacterium]
MRVVVDGDRGQVIPLVAVALVAAGALLWLLAALGAVVVDQARARSAADAAALAGAAEGREAAAAVAEANGARLEAFEADGTDTQVWVRVGRAVARARATRRFEPAATGSPPSALGG